MIGNISYNILWIVEGDIIFLEISFLKDYQFKFEYHLCYLNYNFDINIYEINQAVFIEVLVF